jgi:hypothetical protein
MKRNIFLYFSICLLWIGLLFESNVKAQAIDPIKIGTQESGKFGLHFNLDFIPSGGRFVASDGSLAVRQGYGLGLSLAIDYGIDDRISISGALAGAFELVRIISGTQDQISTAFNGAANLTVMYRLEVNSPFDPSVRISLGYPWIVETVLSARLVRDPLVLVGLLGISKPLETDGVLLNIGAYVLFVANERMTLSGQGNVEIPIGGITVSTSSFMFRIGYSLNPEQINEIGLRVTFIVRGEAIRIGFGFDWNTLSP